jgi:phytoene synthase
MAEQDYIFDLVRREDRDRFLTAMFVPSERRGDIMALYAFNVEVARIRESVSETLIGRMKLQWWRDVIDGLYAGRPAPRGNPVAEALARCVHDRGLDRDDFEALLSARERDLESDDHGFTLGDVTELESYAEGTASRLTCLALQVLGAADEASRSAARHVGIGYALTGILRAVLFHARDHRLYLPRSTLNHAGIAGVEDVQARPRATALAAIIRDLAAIAGAHLAKARDASVPRAAIPALLLGSIAEGHLGALKRARYDVLDPRVMNARASVLSLMWRAWVGKI